MRITKGLAGAVAIAFGLSGIAISSSGCDKLFGDDETEEEDDDDNDDNDDDKDKDETATPEPVDAGVVESGDVETYPEMTKAGGTFRLLKSFQVYRAADESSKRLTGLAAGTLVDFKHFYRDWIMIDWPSGPGQLSPGWIHIRPAERHVLTKKEEKPDAGVEVVVDAGADEVKDAGVEEVKDAGAEEKGKTPDAGKPTPPKLTRKPRLKLKIPLKTK